MDFRQASLIENERFALGRQPIDQPIRDTAREQIPFAVTFEALAQLIGGITAAP